uniref:Choice-of-anchor D domain-containing protein n=1 Tax=Desulfatirhabdium butyrativorans TaxID=340467 RepID=A0A7C4RPV7_9BACT
MKWIVFEKRWTWVLWFLVAGFPAIGAAATNPHGTLQWQGYQQCMTCHETQALDMHGSSHYQWKGPALYTVNGPELQGKMDTALNSYCVAILGNWSACGTCHVGLGAMPTQDATTAQLQNIDCLMCHQKDYKRKKVNGGFAPDTANMTITMDQAVQTVHKPVRINCLQCHAKGGGGDNNKRGDMALAHSTTTDRNFDVHMATTGANLACQQCHTTQDHHIAGRGSDLRETDLDVKMSCSTSSCHTEKSTSNGHTSTDINHHVPRVACQTCHIKTYARNATDTTADESTEMYRDWAVPEWNVGLNRYEPKIVRGSNLKPEYRFWNGTSWNYSIRETAIFDAAKGTYPTSRPEGSINDPNSALYPFKYKKANQPYADSLGVLVALDTSVYFSTGNYDNAVKTGLENMGYSSSSLYSNAETDTYQLITHEVPPKANALSCTQCHTSSATQMNLKSLGYVMKGTPATTCTQCHGQKSIPDYKTLHDKHVKNKQYDCSWCHEFARPERGLIMPKPAKDTTPPSITVFSIPTTSSSLTVPVISLAATDNVGVTGYLLNESSTKPTATNGGWSFVPPTSYTFASSGSKTLYAWAKDAAGNVSNSRAATVVITPTSGEPDISVPTSLNFGSVQIRKTLTQSLIISNRGQKTLNITDIRITGTGASSFRIDKSTLGVEPQKTGTVDITFLPKKAKSYTALVNITSNDPDTPVVDVSLSGTGVFRVARSSR